ncbi:hypothetical protein NX059_002766 [Plenodomus lindquistii]|nr:hypothetical protein NX059_002766 [Plenodomus lindquistii]
MEVCDEFNEEEFHFWTGLDLDRTACDPLIVDTAFSNLIRALPTTQQHLFLQNDLPGEERLLSRAVNHGLVKTVSTLRMNGADSGHGYRFEQPPSEFGQSLERYHLVHDKRLRQILDLNVSRYHSDRELISVSTWPNSYREEVRHISLHDLHSNRFQRYRWKSESFLTNLTAVHVPATDGLIIYGILKIISPSLAHVFESWFQSSLATTGDPYLNYREVGHWSRPVEQCNPELCTMIVFPCLRITTNTVHKTRREHYEAFRERLTTRVSGPFASECTVHLERTLDESYYPGLGAKDLEERNNDQVVSRQFKRSSSIETFPLLIVPQLWLWKFDGIVITAHGYTDIAEEFWMLQSDRTYDVKSSQSEPLDEFPRIPHDDPYLNLGVHIAVAIEAFGKERVIENFKYPPALDLFEGFVVSILADVHKYTEGTDRNSIRFETEKRFHLDLSDCRSELAMIQHVLAQQKEILENFIISRDARHDTRLEEEPEYADVWSRVEEAREILEGYNKRTQKINGDAERIEKSVQDLLNLKRTYASVQDSHASVLLSTAAIGFAFVTIIFAPLAFLTALFALNFQGFENLRVPQSTDDGGAKSEPVYHSGKMAGIFISTEILTIVITALLVLGSLRWSGINLSEFRMGREQGRQGKEGEEKERKVGELKRMWATERIARIMEPAEKWINEKKAGMSEKRETLSKENKAEEAEAKRTEAKRTEAKAKAKQEDGKKNGDARKKRHKRREEGDESKTYSNASQMEKGKNKE